MTKATGFNAAHNLGFHGPAAGKHAGGFKAAFLKGGDKALAFNAKTGLSGF